MAVLTGLVKCVNTRDDTGNSNNTETPEAALSSAVKLTGEVNIIDFLITLQCSTRKHGSSLSGQYFSKNINMLFYFIFFNIFFILFYSYIEFKNNHFLTVVAFPTKHLTPVCHKRNTFTFCASL